MAIIKSFASYQNLSNFGTFINDQSRTSEYFRITEFKDTLTGGKNGFLIEGSEHLKETTEIKIEILDVAGKPIYYEPGNGIPEYYEGISKIVSVHVYEDTPIGLGKITILGELKTYIDDNGVVRDVPTEWRGIYNVKWERTFNVNKNLANETIVRFYQRPKITIDEIVKPIYSTTTPIKVQSGSLQGIPEVPVYGTNLSTWTAGTLYKLKITNGDDFTSSIADNVIEVPSLGYSAVVKEVLNNKEVLVSTPYTINNIVSNFPASPYTSSFEFLENQTFEDSALTGSFAKINIQQLKTFVGDVARVKVYRKSRNDIGDYVFVQESKLESSELLRDITAVNKTDISYGNFTDYNLPTYWISGSNSHPITLNVDKLNASVKVDYSGNDYTNTAKLITSQSFNISKDVEYTISFKTLLSGSIDTSKTLKAYLSSSTYQQEFLTITGNSVYTTRQNVTQNIIASSDADAKLVLEFAGDDWYVSNVSLKNAQETSFSPDEFVLIQEVPRNIPQETYDFRFEFYDINNNYIPVEVNATKTFTGGNNFPSSTKFISFQTDRTAFRFSTGSIGNPVSQTIKFSVQRNNMTGSVTYASAAFDTDGNYISPSSYIGSQYPGALTGLGDGGGLLTLANFTGSHDTAIDSTIRVGSITYTASCEGYNEYETVYRFEDGDNAPGLFVTANTNQFIYKATDLSLNPAGQTITIEAKRKNLASATTPLTINSGSGKPALTYVSTNGTNGVDTYTIAGSSYPYLTGETIYSISGSDQFGNQFSDAIKITPVKILDGLSATLTNDNASLPALSTGFVASGSFVLTSGSVNVKVGNETITFDDDNDSVRANNTFAITNLSGTGCTPNGGNNSNPSTNNYGITTLSADSGSLDITISYKDGAGDTTSIVKTATYTKNKKAAPVLAISITNKAQSVSAKSTGTQIDAFSNATVTIAETYNGTTSNLTLTSLTATSSDISSISTTASTGVVTLNGKTLADATNSTNVSISAVVTDSEGQSRTLTDTITLSKVKKAVPNVEASVSPQSQTVTANSDGSSPATPTSLTVKALEGGTTRLTSVTAVGTSVTVGTITYNGVSAPYNYATIPLSAVAADNASVAITVNYTDSEGTTGTKTITATISKAKTGTNGSPGDPGADGKRTATGLLYYQLSAATAPATPTATSYTFSTNTFASLTANWALGAPTFAAGNSNKYWYSTYTAVETTAGGGTAVPTFSTVTQAIGFTGLVTFTSADNISDGTNTSNIVTPGGVTNHIGGANVTTINGGKISTGVITSTGYTLTGADTLASGSYTGGGTIFNLDNGALRSKNFYITSAGDAFFKGNLTGASGTFSGTVQVGGTNLTAANTLNSNVSSTNVTNALGYTPPTTTQVNDASKTAGYVGGWTINSTSIYTGTEDHDGYTTDGITLYGGGSIHSKNFYINTSGDAFFKGNITGASGTFGGSIRIGSGENVFTADTNGIYLGNETFANAEFRVTPAGALTATSATITGTINATSGNFSGDINSSATITGGTIVGGTIKVGTGDGRLILDSTDFQTRLEDVTNDRTITIGPGGIMLKGDHPDSAESPKSYWYVRQQDDYARMVLVSYKTGITPFEILGFPQGNSLGTITIYNGGIYARNFPSTAYGETYNGLGNGGYAVQALAASTGTTALYVYGKGEFTGDVTANTSDRRLKKNVVNIDSPLEKLSKINGVYFNWNDTAKELMDRDTEIRDIGFIAQEVQAVLPEIIRPAPFDSELDQENSTAENKIYKSKSGEDYLTVQYEKIVPLLVECIKELKSEIEELKRNR